MEDNFNDVSDMPVSGQDTAADTAVQEPVQDAAPAETLQPEAPTETVGPEAPVQVAEAAQPAVRKKKKHTALIVTIIAIVVVLAAGAACTYAFAGDYIKNWYMLKFKEPDEYFKWLMNGKADASYNAMKLKGVADDLLGDKIAENVRDGFSGDFKITLTPSKELLDLVGFEEFDEFKSLGIKAKAAADKDISKFDFGAAVYYADKSVIDADISLDMNDASLYATVPVYKDDIIDISQLLSFGFGTDSFYDMIKAYIEQLKSVEIKQFDFSVLTENYQELCHKYTKLIIDETEDVTITADEQSTIDDTTFEYNLVEAKYDEEDAVRIAKVLLKEMQKDPVVEKIYDDIMRQLGGFGVNMTGAPDWTETSNMLLDKLDSCDKDKLKELGINFDIKAGFFVDAWGKIHGGSIKVNVADTVVKVDLVFNNNENGSASDITVLVNSVKAATISIRGNVSDGVYNGTTEIIPGKLITSALGTSGDVSLKITKKNIKSDGNEFSGEYILTAKCPGEVLERIGISGIELDRYALDIVFSTDIINSSLSLGVVLDGKDFARLAFDTRLESYSDADHLSTTGRNVVPVLNILDSGYITPQSLSKYILDVNDNIADDTFSRLLNYALQLIFGEDYDLDKLRENYDMGYLPDNNDKSYDIITEIAEAGPEPDPVVIASGEDYYAEADGYHYPYKFLAGYASLGQYKGLNYELPKGEEITAEEFEAEKEAFLEEYALISSEEITDRGAQMGDEVYFDVALMIAGQPVETYTFPDSYALLGEYSYGEGLDDDIVGMKPGDSKDVTVTLNEQYGEFAGFTGTFRVTLNSIWKPVEPEWTEDFIVGFAGFESLDACSDYIMQRLTEDSQITNGEIAAELLQEAYSNCYVQEFPEEVREAFLENEYDRYAAYAAMDNQTPEEMFESFGYTVEQFYDELENDVDSAMPYFAFYAAICEEEGITLSEAELEEAISYYEAYYGVTREELAESGMGKTDVAASEFVDKIQELIFNSANIE